MTKTLHVDPTRGLVRGVRAAVLTVPTVGFATVAHATVDSCISLLAIALSLGLCWPAAVALLRRRRRLPALLSWLAAAQLVTHLLQAQLCTDQPSAAHSVGQQLWQQHELWQQHGLWQQPHLWQELSLGISPLMLAAHAGSVLVSALLLGRADAGLWSAQALLRAAARIRRPRLLPAARHWAGPHPIAAQPAPYRRPTRTLWEVAPWVRRGPPVPARCAPARRRTALA